MKYRRLLLFILFIGVGHSYVWGQHHHCLQYTINEGLPANHIYSMCQDTQGYLWLTTSSGLTRFNGREFSLFTDGYQPDASRPRYITNLWKEKLAISTATNSIYQFSNGHFELLLPSQKLDNNNITCLHYHATAQVLFAGTEGGFVVLGKDTVPQYFSNTNKMLPKPFHVTGFQSHKDGIFIFTLLSGIFTYDLKTEKLEKLNIKGFTTTQHISAHCITHSLDTLWAVAHKSILRFKEQNRIDKPFKGVISQITEAFNGEIWFTSKEESLNNQSAGIYKYTEQGMVNMTRALQLSGVEFTSLYFDRREQKLWIGTRQNGLFCFTGEEFTYYNIPSGNPPIDLLCKDEKQALLTKEQLLLFEGFKLHTQVVRQTFDSLFTRFKTDKLGVKYYYLNDATGSFKKYERLRKRGAYPFSNPYSPTDSTGAKFKPHLWQVLKGKQFQYFTNLLSDTLHNIWIGANTGIFQYNTKSNKLKYKDLPDSYFSHFHMTNNQHFLSFSWKEIVEYASFNELEKNTIQNYLDDIIPETIDNIYKKDSSILVFSKESGLFELSHGSISLVLPEDTIKNYGISSVYPCMEEGIICATETGELLGYTNIGHNITRRFYLSKNNGLPVDNIQWLCSDSHSILWFGSNKGLGRLDLSFLDKGNHPYVQLFTPTEGFSDFSGTVAYCDDDKIVIASKKHLITYNTKLAPRSFHNRGVLVFEHIKTNERILSTDLYKNIINKDQVIKFDTHENTFYFNFDLIRYNSQQPGYEYRLDGLSDHWITLRQPQEITYSQLPPGNYRFQLRVPDFPEISPLVFEFSIARPFYTTWYFLAGTGIIFMTIVFWITWYIVTLAKRKARKRSEIKERIAEFEMKALRAQMNPHFIFNAINSIQNFMLDNDIDSALSYLSDFAKLIRTTLDNASHKLVDLQEEINYLKYYLSLEQMRFDNKFSVNINLPPSIEQQSLTIPPMIIQPYVENAIKHGLVHKTNGKGELHISFRIIEEETLLCIVEDNGIGRTRSREINRNRPGAHKPKGSQITQERLQLLNMVYPRKHFSVQISDLYDSYSKPTGTKVEIHFPLLES